MWRFYVYEHLRADGTVFYVGKGCFRKNRKPQYERAHARENRNKGWLAAAATKVGERNPMAGKTGEAHPRSRAVVDAAGARYPSVTAAARAVGLTVQNLHGMLTGNRKNSTTMRFA